MPIDYTQLKTHLWSAADELRANSRLRSHEYSTPVLGLIFLRYADVKFGQVYDELKVRSEQQSSRRRQLRLFEQPARYQASGVFYLPNEARFSYLLTLPEGENIGQKINEAMRLIEQHNPQLTGILPQTYHHLENPTLSTLLKTFNNIPMSVEGDVFGKIYEYFLGQFAKAEGQRGGEFFTPTTLVKLIVEVIEPYHGKILDPACGSGGMFVQSAQFVAGFYFFNNGVRGRSGGDGCNRFVPFGIKQLAYCLQTSNALALQQAHQLTASQFYTLPHCFVALILMSQGAFQVIDNGQKDGEQPFSLGGNGLVGPALLAFAKVVHLSL